MAVGTYRSVGNVIRKVKKQWRSVGSVSRKIKKEWRSVSNVARLTFRGGLISSYSTSNSKAYMTDAGSSGVIFRYLGTDFGHFYFYGDFAGKTMAFRGVEYGSSSSIALVGSDGLNKWTHGFEEYYTEFKNITVPDGVNCITISVGTTQGNASENLLIERLTMDEYDLLEEMRDYI